MRNLVQFSMAIVLCMPFWASGFAGRSEMAYRTGNSDGASLRTAAEAQQQTVTGTVTGTDGAVLPGVSVFVVGGRASASTDANGRFTIAAATGTRLRFTMIGHVSKEVTVTSGSLKVVLEAGQQDLDEVVVVGFGTQRRGNVTGAVTTISTKDNLEARPVADVGRAIQGAAAGLSIAIPSGEVGSDPVIRIRGQFASFEGGAAPLILLDNVEIPSIQLVNPNDVESITVLKDAAASSIYGAKAAFGVILITTKSGTGVDGVTVNYDNNFAFQNPWKRFEMADVNSMKYTVDAFERVGGVQFAGAFYRVNRQSYERAVEWKEKYGGTIGVNDPTVYGRDWYVDPGESWLKYGVRTYDPYEYMVREWAPTQQHNLSVGGTTGKTSFNIGLAAIDQSGMMKPAKKDNFSRYNASMRVTNEINKYITARGGAIFSRRNKEYAYITNSTTADPWLYLYRWAPTYPMGDDEFGNPIRSPESEARAANTANMLRNYLNLNVGTTINILNNWKVDVDYSFANEEYLWNRPGTKYTGADSWSAGVARFDASGNPVYVDSDGQVVAAGTPGASRAYNLNNYQYTANGANPDHFARDAANGYKHTINAVTTYNLNLEGGHDVGFLLGLNRVTDDFASQWSQRNYLIDIVNPQFNFGIATQTSGGDALWESQLGYFGRINYAYKNRYLLEGNLRYDGSSKFPTDLKWRWFPSFSAGWVLSEESFMEDARSWLSLAKFRGSWGTIGDQTVRNSLYIPTLEPAPSFWIGADGQRSYHVGTPPAVSASITWQDITTVNLGVDARFFNHRLGLTFDWYQRDTENMIVPGAGVPATFGTGAPKGNFGSLRTSGWELALDFNHRFENGLGINLRGNLSDAKSVIQQYGITESVNEWYVGKTYGEIWGYRTDRLYQKDDFEVDNSGNLIKITLTEAESVRNVGKEAYKLKPGPNGEKPVYQAYLQNSANFLFGPGDVKFKDLNGDGELDAGASLLDDHGDREIIGNFTPRYEYGFRLGADFKGVDFSVFLQGVGSRQMWGEGFMAIPGFNSSDGAMPAAIADNYWREDHTGAFYPRAYNNLGSGTTNNMQVQDRYLLDMSYMRLKNLTVGYTLPASLTRSVHVSSLRIYAAMENLLTWDNLKGLPIDPEEISGFSMWNTSNYNLGRTGTGTPTFKSVSFGVQLNF